MASNDNRNPLAATVGQELAIQHLRKLLQRKVVPHALLFSGPASIGKFLTAKAFAAELLQCFSTTETPPAAKGNTGANGASANGNSVVGTDHLRFALKGTHPDLHTLELEEGQKDIPVDSVRELTAKLHLKSYLSSATVALVNDAHRMSLAASNALLMTLEEPSANSFIILVTDAAHRLPATILSRCQTINFSRLLPEHITEIVTNLLGENPSTIPNFNKLVSALDGSFEPLQMSRFFDRASGELLERDKFKEELERKCAEVAALRGKLARVTGLNSQSSLASSAPSAPPALSELISLASAFCEEKEFSPLFWRVLQLELRIAVRKSAPELVGSSSSLLTQCVFAEQNIRERNASQVLQMTSLFVKSGDIASQAIALASD